MPGTQHNNTKHDECDDPIELILFCKISGENFKSQQRKQCQPGVSQRSNTFQDSLQQQTEREDSPWYPTIHLFRQTRLNEWDDVFERIGAELATLIARRA